MAGHSKWANIKRKKGAADKKRGKIFTQCIHEVTVAVREGGGGDPGSNSRLRFALDKARSNNVPGDTIDRAIKRATGEIKGEESEELSYEGYGPGGTAVFLEVMTNNRNRTVGEIRHAFSKCGGALGENGCVAWMFNKKGLIVVPKKAVTEERLMELALEAGADDISDEGEVFEIVTSPAEFFKVRTAIQDQGIAVESAEVQMLPTNRVTVEGSTAEQMMRLLELLEDLDDVLTVSANCDFAEEP